MMLFSMRRFADMERQARRLLRREPGSGLLNEMLGIALVAQGLHAEALPFLQRAVQREPRDAQFWENLGLCQRQLDQLAEADGSLTKALEMRPDSPETLNAHGSVLRALRHHEEAQARLERALALKPDHVAAQFNLGNLHRDLGRFAKAEACFRRVIALQPADPAAHASLATVLLETGRFKEAIESAQTVLDRAGPLPEGVSDRNREALNSAASVLARTGLVGAAARIFRATFAFKPSPACALAAISAARRACDWDLARRIETEQKSAGPNAWAADTTSPFPLLMIASATAADQLAGVHRYAQRYAATLPVARAPRPQRERLRIGYLSGDLCGHPVARLAAGVFEAHDRDRFEIVAYDYSPPTEDDIRRRLESGFDHVVPVHDLAYREAAERIAADACDIVVDLTGWTGQSRSGILASRPAPVQIQWLGYPGTMGASWLDYIVADSILVRPGEEGGYSEKIIRLPSTYQPNDDKRVIAETDGRSAHGLPEDAFVFCSFNQIYKITPETFDVWMRLLASVDNSVLWLLRLDPDATEALRREAQARGINPDRLVFAKWASSQEHLARIRHADLALDCFPYGSHTTASDVLWMGVPLIALAGETFASRVSASILGAAGLSDLIARSLDEYHDLALRLATDRAVLSDWRGRVDACRRTSVLFDTQGFTRRLEAAFCVAWDRHVAGLPPDHITLI